MERLFFFIPHSQVQKQGKLSKHFVPSLRTSTCLTPSPADPGPHSAPLLFLMITQGFSHGPQMVKASRESREL